MEFKIDENLPTDVADLLRQAGHRAVTALEQDLGGASDSEVAAVYQKEGLVLITMDTDFADIRSYPPAEFPGLVVLRLHSQDKPHVVDVLGRLTPLLSTEPLRRHLWIVDETRLRIRG